MSEQVVLAGELGTRLAVCCQGDAGNKPHSNASVRTHWGSRRCWARPPANLAGLLAWPAGPALLSWGRQGHRKKAAPLHDELEGSHSSLRACPRPLGSGSYGGATAELCGTAQGTGRCEGVPATGTKQDRNLGPLAADAPPPPPPRSWCPCPCWTRAKPVGPGGLVLRDAVFLCSLRFSPAPPCSQPSSGGPPAPGTGREVHHLWSEWLCRLTDALDKSFGEHSCPSALLSPPR